MSGAKRRYAADADAESSSGLKKSRVDDTMAGLENTADLSPTPLLTGMDALGPLTRARSVRIQYQASSSAIEDEEPMRPLPETNGDAQSTAPISPEQPLMRMVLHPTSPSACGSNWSTRDSDAMERTMAADPHNGRCLLTMIAKTPKILVEGTHVMAHSTSEGDV
jgi:hypothetical protein